MSSDSEVEKGGEEAAVADGGTESGKASTGPLSILFPADRLIWSEARRLLGDKTIRVEDLAICASQDPAIVIELIKTSNALYFSGGKSAITSVKTAIIRLGEEVVLDILEKLKERPAIEDEEVSHWLEVQRSRCKRTAIVGRLLAEALARTLSDDCQSAALLMHAGEMLAVTHFKEQYVKLAEELSRSSVIYKLAQELRFDVERMGLSYLRRQGMPETLLFAIDREARARSPERAIMKPICFAASEIIEAFDNNRWEKLSPGKTLAPKSSLRSLQIPEAQYTKIYERATQYLVSARLQDSKKAEQLAALDASGKEQTPTDSVPNITTEAAAPDKAPDTFQDEIAQLISSTIEPSAPETESQSDDKFNLGAAKTKQAVKPRADVAKPSVVTTAAEKSKNLSSGASQLIGNIATMFDQAKSGEDLLRQLLEMLVDKGPFEKSALIVVSKDRKNAIVVAARGPNIGNGQTLIITDPLSPLAQCFSRIQSFGTQDNKLSPFGSKAFALSPIDADHDTPVALYADCGNTGAVSFEARRIFRNVVQILNEKLPSIPGGIPVEVQ